MKMIKACICHGFTGSLELICCDPAKEAMPRSPLLQTQSRQTHSTRLAHLRSTDLAGRILQMQTGLFKATRCCMQLITCNSHKAAVTCESHISKALCAPYSFQAWQWTSKGGAGQHLPAIVSPTASAAHPPPCSLTNRSLTGELTHMIWNMLRHRERSQRTIVWDRCRIWQVAISAWLSKQKITPSQPSCWKTKRGRYGSSLQSVSENYSRIGNFCLNRNYSAW